jgi:putative solute:sodium symporter small subunit
MMDDHDLKQKRAHTYWQRTTRLTLWLMLIWFVVTFTAIFFARQLSDYTLFGWPISFFMAAQGSVLLYVTIVGVYALWMRRLDKQYNEQNGDDDNGEDNE